MRQALDLDHRRRRWLFRISGFLSLAAAVLLAVLLVIHPAWAHIGSVGQPWGVVVGLAVLGILLMLATLTSLVAAVLIGLVLQPHLPWAFSARLPG